LDSTLTSLDTLENATLDVARKAGFHGDALEKIGLAVREIAANAIIHGNRLDSRKNIVATIVRTSKQIKITVSDQGAGFDLAGLPDSRHRRCYGVLDEESIWLGHLWMSSMCEQRLVAPRLL
jgi:serine/threonine-protein kinase RsbW